MDPEATSRQQVPSIQHSHGALLVGQVAFLGGLSRLADQLGALEGRYANMPPT